MNRVRCTRISMPTPFLVGPVNVHLLCGDAAVLIDAGFDSPGGRDALESGLKRAKMKPKDLDAILITHGHLDHFGMAARLKEESGAELWVHRSERLFLERYPASYERVLKRFLRYGRRHGFGEDEFEGMFRLYREYRSFGAPVTPDRYFKEGEKAVFGSLELEPIFSPGHTAGSTCLLDTGTGRLFTGDSVLEQITPVSFFQGGSKNLGLAAYRSSLDRLREWDVLRVYPGHGRPFRDLPVVIDRIQRHIDLRLKRIRDGLSKKEPRELRVIAEAAFGKAVPEPDRWVGFGEALGMMEVMEEAGAVRRVEEEGKPVRFLSTE